LNDVAGKKETIDLGLDSCRAALQYFRKQGGQMDKMIEQLDNSASLWVDVIKHVPVTTQAIVPLVKTWSTIIEEQIDAYNREMTTKLKDFKTRSFWSDEISPKDAIISIGEAERFLLVESEELIKKTQLVRTFDFPHLIKTGNDCFEEMTSDLTEIKKLWNVTDNLFRFVKESTEILWSEMNTDELDECSKNQVKAVKNLHKCTRWSKAYKLADKMSKDFLNTIPLISLLGAKCMRERHWQALQTVTKKDFVPPYADKNLLLGGILELKLHEFSNDVEEICDQAAKELKIENTLVQLTDRWLGIEWLMEPYKDTDVPLLKMAEEDFESLEADQLTVQGMLASRFVKQFETEAQKWQKQLANIADVFVLLGEIQRTWSYLEPLFIGSEEVKRELPEDAKRFEGIDMNVKKELTVCWDIKNCDESCNQEGLLRRLENILEQLEICKKSLSDFLDGRRRQFPRYVSYQIYLKLCNLFTHIFSLSLSLFLYLPLFSIALSLSLFISPSFSIYLSFFLSFSLYLSL
jgi:dynein heavy chain